MSKNFDWVHIQVYNDSRGVEVQRNPDCNLPALLGSMDIAKSIIMQGSIPNNPFTTRIRDAKHIKANARKKRVSKDEAMKIYMQLGQKIQERLLAMQKCDDVASFEIDQDLIQKL